MVPECGNMESIFGEGGGEQLAQENGVKLLGELYQLAETN